MAVYEDKILRELTVENLSEAIADVINDDPKRVAEDIQNFLYPRLDFICDPSYHIFFLFEKCYIETEWKDMISVHYINTSYNVKNAVMRVHLFFSDTVDEKKYAGCFTLRTIDDVRFMLSYIWPNWKRLITEDGSDIYVMTYKKKVHILGREIEFDTYPLFVQDNAVIKCAQAGMISMSSYLHEKYGYNKMRVLKINEAYSTGKTRVFPSKGLTPPQMMEIFNYYNIPAESQICYKEPEELKPYIDFCLESSLPVLLSIIVDNTETQKEERHIIQIIGHTLEPGTHEKKYLVYDDSGLFIRSSAGTDGFVYPESWENIKEKIKPGKSILFYPIHEKVYISFDDIQVFFEDLCKRLKLEELMKAVNDPLTDRRILIVDNVVLKDFLKNKIQLDIQIGDKESMQKEIENIINQSLPHYLWYCEFQTAQRNLIFIADPTYNNKTTKNIILNKNPIFSTNVLGILQKQTSRKPVNKNPGENQ